ncbi:hypothetical protein LJC46_01380 [Desulfovibrio sp. OttesenSCG-928-G15]|nr:hypothetical protein [Desulfovibrio sp. OttesenSCG-928-G15]
MKKNVFCLFAALLVFATMPACKSLDVAEMIDTVAEPENLYVSGTDLLSGAYQTLAGPGDKNDSKDADIRMEKVEKGWKMHSGTRAFTMFEVPPDQAADMIKGYDPKTMQCADEKYFGMFCTLPKGKKLTLGKLTVTSQTGHIVIMKPDSWRDAVKR